MNEITEAAKFLGSLTSKKKARAARINGKKGGRPRMSKKAKSKDDKNIDASRKLGKRSKGLEKVVKV